MNRVPLVRDGLIETGVAHHEHIDTSKPLNGLRYDKNGNFPTTLLLLTLGFLMLVVVLEFYLKLWQE